MPTPRQPPAAHVTENGRFPNGPYRRDTPKEVFLAAGLSTRLNTKIGDRSIRHIARQADLSPQTILNTLNGTSWPDLRTIARLETALDADLWGKEHRQHRLFYYRYYPPRR